MLPRLRLYVRDLAATQREARQRQASREPAVGIFWHIPDHDTGETSLLAEHTPLSEAPLEAGLFKNHTRDHYSMWNDYKRKLPELHGYDYSAFPRGRVTYLHENGGQFNLLVDPKVQARPDLVRELHRTFNLPPKKTRVMTDPHYHSDFALPKPKKPPAPPAPPKPVSKQDVL